MICEEQNPDCNRNCIKQKQYTALKNIHDYLDKLITENYILKEQIKNIKKDKKQINKILLVIENELKDTS